MNLEAGGTQIGLAVGMVFNDYNPANNNLLSIRGMITADPFGKFEPTSDPNLHADEYIWDAGVMFGKAFQKDNYFLSASVGIGIVGGLKNNSVIALYPEGHQYISEIFKTIGIPIQAQAHFIPLRFIGVGLEGIANVNPKYSIWGVMVSLQLGGLLF
jgi:hypothetical protein